MTRFKIPEMSCGHCTAAIENSILDADEGADLRFDLSRRSVEIDSVLDQAAILAAIKSAGFEATPTG